MAAHREVEIKLELPPAALPQLRRLPLLRAADASAKSRAETSVYFDTDKQKLRRHGVVLRVRHAGDRYVQTIKSSANRGPFARGEWERRIEGGGPDLDGAAGTPLARLLSRKVRRRLRPVFETRIRRSLYPLRRDGSEIALTIDQGTIETGGSSMPVCEIELELKRGAEGKLFDVAREIAQSLPIQLGLRSKADRGHGLIDGNASKPAKFAGARLTEDMTARDAFKRIGSACLQQIVANVPPLLRSDAEGVHQMRVGLRHLRAALSLFKKLLNDPQSTKLKGELKWLTAELGPARELDVLINRVVRPVTKRKSRWQGIPTLSRRFKDRREDAIVHAQEAVESERFRMLMLDLAAWLEIGQWTTPADDLVRARGETPAETFAAGELTHRARKIRKKRKNFAELDLRRRHKLRIQAKKVRYAVEFFADLFPGRKANKRREKFLAVLKRVQNKLGDLNDIMVHERMLAGRKVRRGCSRENAFAAGLLTGREDARRDAAIAAATKALARFAKTDSFWC